MKKMYKKPITDTIPLNTDEVMQQSTLGVSNGGTDQLESGTEGSAPKRKLF